MSRQEFISFSLTMAAVRPQFSVWEESCALYNSRAVQVPTHPLPASASHWWRETKGPLDTCWSSRTVHNHFWLKVPGQRRLEMWWAGMAWLLKELCFSNQATAVLYDSAFCSCSEFSCSAQALWMVSPGCWAPLNPKEAWTLGGMCVFFSTSAEPRTKLSDGMSEFRRRQLAA